MYESRRRTSEENAALAAERRAGGFPMHAPPHPEQGCRHYFITAVCYEHAPHLHSTERRAALLEQYFEQLSAEDLAAWVVLPNHYHLLVRRPSIKAFSEQVRRTHARLARRWNLEDDAPGRQVWHRYADRAIRSPRHYAVTLNYIHYNPVKHGHAALPYDWDASSVHAYRARHGRAWLRHLWQHYPLHDYGRGWDRS